MFEVHYTRETKAEKVVEEIKRSLNIEPNLAIFFLAGDLSKKAGKIKLDCNSISVPVEGIITPKGVWSKGVLVLATDSEATIKIFRGDVSDVYQKVKKAEKGNLNLLIYPLVFFKSRITLLKTLLKLKRSSELEKVSRIFEDIIYPMNTMLRPFRDEGKTAAAMNLFPLDFGVGVPRISLNGKPLGRSITHVSFKDRINCNFADTFPQRGKSFEETAEILSQELTNAKKVSVLKKGTAIKEIDGMSVREFLRKQKIIMRENLENDMTQQKLFGATPYVLCLISKETHGSSALGLLDYELKFYPSLFDTDVFYDEAVFAGEFVRGGVKRVMENLQESDFAIIDQNFMLMFEERIVEIAKVIKGYGVFSSYPSYTGKLGKNFMSEVEKNVCVNGTETMVFLKFK
ncbi:MAG: hypothetical protein ACK401_03160 [Archaeoglobaceae archaeon]